MSELSRHGTGERGIFRVTRHEDDKRAPTTFLGRIWYRIKWKCYGRFKFKVRRAERGHWVWREGTFIPFQRVIKIVNAPFIWKDEVDAFVNHATNRVETSMSTYRKNLKENGFFEKGNDRMPAKKLQTRQERFEEIRAAAKEAKRQQEWGMVKSTSDQRELWKQEQELLDYKI